MGLQTPPSASRAHPWRLARARRDRWAPRRLGGPLDRTMTRPPDMPRVVQWRPPAGLP
jgi:hypothetical protein